MAHSASTPTHEHGTPSPARLKLASRVPTRETWSPLERTRSCRYGCRLQPEDALFCVLFCALATASYSRQAGERSGGVGRGADERFVLLDSGGELIDEPCGELVVRKPRALGGHRCVPIFAEAGADALNGLTPGDGFIADDGVQ